MITKMYAHRDVPRERQIPRLSTWQRLSVWRRLIAGGVLIGAFVISAALIYFQPGTYIFVDTATEPAIVTTENTLALPLGTDLYYYWAQHRPLDSQP